MGHMRIGLAFLLVAALLTGCDASAFTPGGSTGTGAPGPGPSAVAQQLATLTVSDGLSMAGYSRDKFPHWIQQGNGCDTRDVVLQRQGTGVRVGTKCKIGSRQWTTRQRQDFANDLTRPRLIAVTGSVNEAKGDQDPSQWKPPSRDFWCT